MHDTRPMMSVWTGVLCGLVLALAVAPAKAQLAQQAFQIVITRAGNDCRSIETTRAIGTGSNGDALVAVACANGGRHVISIHSDNSVSYMSSCQAFEAGTGLVCFNAQ